MMIEEDRKSMFEFVEDLDVELGSLLVGFVGRDNNRCVMKNSFIVVGIIEYGNASTSFINGRCMESNN
jgi:hypothetical protein